MKGKRTNREEKRKFSKLYSLICILSLYKGNIEINQIIKKISSSNKKRWYKILRITSYYMPYHFDCKLLSLSLYVFTLSPNYNIIKYEYVKFLKFPFSFTYSSRSQFHLGIGIIFHNFSILTDWKLPRLVHSANKSSLPVSHGNKYKSCTNLTK